MSFDNDFDTFLTFICSHLTKLGQYFGGLIGLDKFQIHPCFFSS